MTDPRIKLFKGDITTLKVDAIVNAANKSLLGGGGVDGAIHRAAGSDLLRECSTLKGCEAGNAKLTKGYCLPAKYVIHAVGPIWKGGDANEAELLASCYRKTMQLALDNKVTSLAFPSISTGTYRFPKAEAAYIAISEVKAFLAEHPSIEQVTFVVFDDENYHIYQNNLA